MNSDELKDKYKHFSMRDFPFQDTIIDAIPEKGIPYSEREKWFNHIYLLTSKGYYIQINEFFNSNAVPYDYDEQQPYGKFIRGIGDIVYCYAFNSEIADTISFIKNLLSKGMLTVCKVRKGRFEGRYSFLWSLPWYSWLSAEYRNN